MEFYQELNQAIEDLYIDEEEGIPLVAKRIETTKGVIAKLNAFLAAHPSLEKKRN